MSAQMASKRNPVSGGIFLAIGALVGGLWGVSHGQAVFGLAAGVGAGVAIALLVWLVDRRRG